MCVLIHIYVTFFVYVRLFVPFTTANYNSYIAEVLLHYCIWITNVNTGYLHFGINNITNILFIDNFAVFSIFFILFTANIRIIINNFIRIMLRFCFTIYVFLFIRMFSISIGWIDKSETSNVLDAASNKRNEK